MGIAIKNALVEVHHSISMVKHYHGSLQQVYLIINTKIAGIELDLVLQMIFKTINNLLSPNGLVFTLLVFGAYPRMIKLNTPFLSITQYAMAIKKAIN